MKILVQLKAENILEKEYEGTVTKQVQTVIKTEKKGFEVVKVKLTDELLNFKEGDYIRVPVQISAMNNQVFYRQDGKIEVVKGN